MSFGSPRSNFFLLHFQFPLSIYSSVFHIYILCGQFCHSHYFQNKHLGSIWAPRDITMFCLLGGGGSAAVVEASLPFLFQRSSRPPFFSALQLVWLHGLIRQLNCEVLDLITVGIQIAPSLGLVDISFLSKSTRVRYVSPFHIRR